jgi:carbon monoxide dehydrogenase subunit G
MDVRAESTLRADPARARAAVEDLNTYPRWLSFVVAVESTGDGGWWVDLGARLGPLRRTKRVRMERTTAREGGPVVFERREHDGREHNEWILRVDLLPEGGGTRVHGHLRYGGSGLPPGIDRLVARELARAGARLDRLLEAEGSG